MAHYVKSDFLSLVISHHANPRAGKYYCDADNLEIFSGKDAVAIPHRISFNLNGEWPRPEFSKENYTNNTYNGSVLNENSGQPVERYCMRFNHTVNYTIEPLFNASFKIDDTDTWPKFRRLGGDLLFFRVTWKGMANIHIPRDLK